MKTYCPLPWISAAIRNDGAFRVCCNANTTSGRGLLKKESLVLVADQHTFNEARNSASLKKIRQQMLQGEWPEECQRCQTEESVGIKSKRIYSQDSFEEHWTAEHARQNTEADGTIQLSNVPLLDLDIRFGNKCNLACRMCGPADSSLWVKELERMGEKPPKKSFDWYQAPGFWTDLEQQGTDLRHIYVVGGEPLLISEHFDFLEYLVHQNLAAQIILEYNTNLTVLPERVLALWSHFKEIRVGISLDGAGEVNDYIRYPSRFEVIEKNLERLDRFQGSLSAWITASISLYNLHHLVEFMRWIESKKFTKIGVGTDKAFFVPHPVHRPRHLNIQILSEQLKQEYEKHLRQELKDFLAEDTLSAEKKNRAQEIVEKYLKFMRVPNSSEAWGLFTEQTRKLDSARNQSYQSTKPLFKF